MTPHNIPIDVLNFLTLCFATACTNQTNNGIRFELTFAEYLVVVCAHPRAIESIITRYERRKAKNNTMAGFKTAYVLSWVSKEARNTGVMNKDTAEFMCKEASLERFKVKKGDKMRPASCAKISKARKGKGKSEETRARMAASHKGEVKSPESNEKRRAKMLEYHAERRAKLAATSGEASNIFTQEKRFPVEVTQSPSLESREMTIRPQIAQSQFPGGLPQRSPLQPCCGSPVAASSALEVR